MSINIFEASFKLLGHHFCNLIAIMLSDIPSKPSALSLYQYTNVYLGVLGFLQDGSANMKAC